MRPTETVFKSFAKILPKRGFTNIFAKDLNTVSVGRIQMAIDAGKLDAKSPITVAALVEAKVLRRVMDGVRVLSDGELTSAIHVDVAGASRVAIEKIEKAGGTVKVPAKKAAE